MAWIKSFERKEGSGRIQPTQVVGYVKVFDTTDGTRIVQIDTLGSHDRDMPGKQSQTFQIGKEAASQLCKLLTETYDLQR